MADDVRSGIGYLIPAAALVGFVVALVLEYFVLSVVIAVAGILVWLIYIAVMESQVPNTMGNMVILFGVLLSLGILMAYGWEQNMFGGFEIKAEGTLLSLIILFFSVLIGVVLRRQTASPKSEAPSLTDREKELVRQALDRSDEDTAEGEPRVIVVKSETSEEEDEEDEEDVDPALYAYPPEYYEDYDDEDYDDEEYDEEEEEED